MGCTNNTIALQSTKSFTSRLVVNEDAGFTLDLVSWSVESDYRMGKIMHLIQNNAILQLLQCDVDKLIHPTQIMECNGTVWYKFCTIVILLASKNESVRYNPISVIRINGTNKIMNLDYTFRTLKNENKHQIMNVHTEWNCLIPILSTLAQNHSGLTH